LELIAVDLFVRLSNTGVAPRDGLERSAPVVSTFAGGPRAAGDCHL